MFKNFRLCNSARLPESWGDHALSGKYGSAFATDRVGLRFQQGHYQRNLDVSRGLAMEPLVLYMGCFGGSLSRRAEGSPAVIVSLSRFLPKTRGLPSQRQAEWGHPFCQKRD